MENIETKIDNIIKNHPFQLFNENNCYIFGFEPLDYFEEYFILDHINKSQFEMYFEGDNVILKIDKYLYTFDIKKYNLSFPDGDIFLGIDFLDEEKKFKAETKFFVKMR